MLRRDPDFERHVSETIDYVLSQFTNSDAGNRKSQSTQHTGSDQQCKQNTNHRYEFRHSSRSIPSLQQMISIKEAELAASAKDNLETVMDSPQISTTSESNPVDTSKENVSKRPKSYYRPKIDLFKLSETILGES
ncbi:unnamed protein product [Schistosoma margrebowiei]|uniref:Uncharacterized protein n=1 Tax=Schistosoma margrebowiei TaxID=48269 RepID=A0A3P7YL39_9TREM|nr:unnamed protein product [Schistosoma margrebowiei]